LFPVFGEKRWALPIQRPSGSDVGHSQWHTKTNSVGKVGKSSDKAGAMLITTLLILWAGFTVVLIGLLIYRGTLRMHEDCQIFLDQAEDHLAKEQEQLNIRMDRLQSWVRMSGAGSAILIVIIASLEMYLLIAARMAAPQ
jgi:hypothetical protein